MVSSIQCVLVEVPVDRQATSQPVARDLLPWADPYIARLVLKHQLQVAREERAARRGALAESSERFSGHSKASKPQHRGGDSRFGRLEL